MTKLDQLYRVPSIWCLVWYLKLYVRQGGRARWMITITLRCRQMIMISDIVWYWALKLCTRSFSCCISLLTFLYLPRIILLWWSVMFVNWIITNLLCLNVGWCLWNVIWNYHKQIIGMYEKTKLCVLFFILFC